MIKFKVGEKVKVNNNSASENCNAEPGHTAIVTSNIYIPHKNSFLISVRWERCQYTSNGMVLDQNDGEYYSHMFDRYKNPDWDN